MAVCLRAHGITVTRDHRKKLSWRVHGVLWEHVGGEFPGKLYREGDMLTVDQGIGCVWCLSDAVMFSIAFEAGTLCRDLG